LYCFRARHVFKLYALVGMTRRARTSYTCLLGLIVHGTLFDLSPTTVVLASPSNTGEIKILPSRKKHPYYLLYPGENSSIALKAKALSLVSYDSYSSCTSRKFVFTIGASSWRTTSNISALLIYCPYVGGRLVVAPIIPDCTVGYDCTSIPCQMFNIFISFAT